MKSLQSQNTETRHTPCVWLTVELKRRWQMLHNMMGFFFGWATPKVWLITAFWTGSIWEMKRTDANTLVPIHGDCFSFFICSPSEGVATASEHVRVGILFYTRCWHQLSSNLGQSSRLWNRSTDHWATIIPLVYNNTKYKSKNWQL